MDKAEGTGKTLEDAQQDALQQLGASSDDVEFEVIERPGTLGGIFGRSAYRVLATVRGSDPVEPTHSAGVSPSLGGPETGGDESVAEPHSAQEAQEDDESSRSSDAPNYALAEAGRDLLQQMVDLMGIEGEVKIESCTEEEVALNVEGEDMGILIGRHGATLDAVQLIVAIGANRHVEQGARVIVDAEGYRQRHQEMIEARARKLADDAKEHGREVVVPDLKAYERRLMHMALKDDPTVETYSEGDGDDRVLVISPL